MRADRRRGYGLDPARERAGGPYGEDADLVETSVRAMLANQQPSGAFIASPDFPQYHYCWLRDASFVAHALDRIGELGASARYHDWVVTALEGIAPAMEAAMREHRAGRELEPAEMPPARFSLAGLAVADNWPNFQMDGYGIWLWSLQQHLHASGTEHVAERALPSVERTARYLATFALSPCFDVWEEDGQSVHTSTLACAYGGLMAAASLLDRADMADRAEEVQAVVLERGRRAGRFEKSSANREVDASSIWLSVPFALVDAFHPALVETAAEIAGRLEFEGGIRRYPGDTYFGGGAWPLLSASLGWHYASLGDIASARVHHEWIAGHFDVEGRLGEQYGGEHRDPVMYREWVSSWGHPAKELLWSHAMFVILSGALASAAPERSFDRSTDRSTDSGEPNDLQAEPNERSS
ncbi:MAG TPA: glycoside hydrolase family 15 protein [Acidimicrobiales bacterium]|nr:glycoside hydrolase family 15 protein [Acidimicrobiales bacterium]